MTPLYRRSWLQSLPARKQEQIGSSENDMSHHTGHDAVKGDRKRKFSSISESLVWISSPSPQELSSRVITPTSKRTGNIRSTINPRLLLRSAEQADANERFGSCDSDSSLVLDETYPDGIVHTAAGFDADAILFKIRILIVVLSALNLSVRHHLHVCPPRSSATVAALLLLRLTLMISPPHRF